MKAVISWAIGRLKEPSSYAAIASGLALIGVSNIDNGQLVLIGGGVAAVLGIIIGETPK